MRRPYDGRRSVRLQQFDYGSTGAYFITVCTHERQHHFGSIHNGVMCLSPLGGRVWKEWAETFGKRADFSPGAFVVMPNHWHGIVHITRTAGDDWNPERIETFGASKKDTLATMLKGMKAAISSHAIHALGLVDKLWQRGFHEHVIRNATEYDKIERYILHNPCNWAGDCFHRRGTPRVPNTACAHMPRACAFSQSAVWAHAVCPYDVRALPRCRKFALPRNFLCTTT